MTFYIIPGRIVRQMTYNRAVFEPRECPDLAALLEHLKELKKESPKFHAPVRHARWRFALTLGLQFSETPPEGEIIACITLEKYDKMVNDRPHGHPLGVGERVHIVGVSLLCPGWNGGNKDTPAEPVP